MYTQVRDTATLFRLPNERFLSLRFLTAQVLKADIQDETHDSIEDARAALLLERKYTQLEASGKIHKRGYCIYSSMLNGWLICDVSRNSRPRGWERH